MVFMALSSPSRATPLYIESCCSITQYSNFRDCPFAMVEINNGQRSVLFNELLLIHEHLFKETTRLVYGLSLGYVKRLLCCAERLGDMNGLRKKLMFVHPANRELWRPHEKEDNTLKEDTPAYLPYDLRLKEPHAAISRIVGSSFAAWITGQGMLVSGKKQSPISADVFGSTCFTFQKGRFSKLYGDLTRVDACVDISSASALAKRIFNAIRSSCSNNSGCRSGRFESRFAVSEHHFDQKW
ncbi:hypothetical protein AALP_AA3G112100 [Arabis alpina]|uniref:Uncharacterized protein n=1 Tax=Arabis alpina TaxID=50452 RepID=A0A087H8H7_ARAAL|nr:hypothetical protein AALP_AA3G112100 [Arabis alpina]